MNEISFQTLMDWVLMYLRTLRPGKQPKEVKLYVFDEINRKKYPVVHAQWGGGYGREYFGLAIDKNNAEDIDQKIENCDENRQ